ncbi:4-alpha-glucanotransferase [Echinimonas agarilytica]|uniref:4-alpha-glucanotransferase n=1 Tax=Echinimonas agarilytica TaxID=1215918 RepID=A0AA41W5V1_9GAMM|nr:4-alpha-glucanotransferase [Echinimonas agarilytica]MCM2679467.1 4-alpha-glucanotransferase [Echinimonas agarilytica]
MVEHHLQQLCSEHGIESNYTDAWGNPATVVPESKAKLLAAMGYSVSDAASLELQIHDKHIHDWAQPVAPVLVCHSAESYAFEIRLPKEQISNLVKWTITTEEGNVVEGTLTPIEGQKVSEHEIDGVVYQGYSVSIWADLPWGYHQLVLSNPVDQVLGHSSLIVTPAACYSPQHVIDGAKLWGPSVQLYCLRSTRNWGVGDFTDLKFLLKQVAGKGGDFVGLNPIHALYPSNPESASPYSPSSRRWLNIIYIDVTAIAEYSDSKAAQAIVNSAEFKTRIEALKSPEWVDYTGVMQAKIEVLDEVFATFKAEQLSKNTKRARAFRDFVKAGGDSLLEQAAFDALQRHFYAEGINAWGWPAWPEEYQDFSTDAVKAFIKKHKAKVDFFAFLQFIADEQLQQANAVADESGMSLGLYRDLAVGVSEGSTELWANKGLYLQDASVGAPPDVLGPLGQNWGLPPIDPEQARQQAYKPFIDLFRSNMRHCGALRIDHVMALLRLWWIPKGETADKGAYVYYPIDDLLAILALESHRNQCLIIGEDLGTVPDGIFETLQESGVYSYRVFFFERSKEDGGFYAPQHYPVQAMSTLTTHDMPTLRGFWQCDDLKLGKELGLYVDEDVLQTLYADRHDSKQRILDSLHGMGAIPDHISKDVNWVAMTKELNFALQQHMAAGSSALLALQLEDWLEMEKPVNVPGTSSEYPNWRRKLTHNLEELFADKTVGELLAELTEIRKKAFGVGA